MSDEYPNLARINVWPRSKQAPQPTTSIKALGIDRQERKIVEITVRLDPSHQPTPGQSTSFPVLSTSDVMQPVLGSAGWRTDLHYQFKLSAAVSPSTISDFAAQARDGDLFCGLWTVLGYDRTRGTF